MESNDDNLYTATVRQTPKFGWGWKLGVLNRKQDPKRRENHKRLAPRQNPWALSGPDDLR
jgi:hypothetical protein